MFVKTILKKQDNNDSETKLGKNNRNKLSILSLQQSNLQKNCKTSVKTFVVTSIKLQVSFYPKIKIQALVLNVCQSSGKLLLLSQQLTTFFLLKNFWIKGFCDFVFLKTVRRI